MRTFATPEDSVFTDDGADVVLLSGTFASPFARERLYDDRWVVIAADGAAPEGASALDLLQSLPHVVFEGPNGRHPPYAVLAEHQIPCTVRQIVPDNLLIPALVAQVGGVALHRHRVASSMRKNMPLRIEEFPYPLPGLGIDMVWNPRLADETFVAWMRGLLHEAAGSPGGIQA